MIVHVVLHQNVTCSVRSVMFDFKSVVYKDLSYYTQRKKILKSLYIKIDNSYCIMEHCNVDLFIFIHVPISLMTCLLV